MLQQQQQYRHVLHIIPHDNENAFSLLGVDVGARREVRKEVLTAMAAWFPSPGVSHVYWNTGMYSTRRLLRNF